MKSMKMIGRIAASAVFLLSTIATIPVSAAPAAFETTSINWKLIGIVIGAMCLIFGILFAFIVLRKKRKNKNVMQGVNLEEFLMQWGKAIPFATAIKIIAPILKQLLLAPAPSGRAPACRSKKQFDSTPEAWLPIRIHFHC